MAFFLYSKATAGGGAIVKSTQGGGGTTRSTSSGGGSTQTSSSGGGTSRSTQSGGGSAQTSSAGGDHRHLMFVDQGQGGSSPTRMYTGFGSSVFYNIMASGSGNIYTAGSSGNHSHNVTIPAHSHEFSTPNHTHNVSIPSHTHDVTIPSHTHEFSLPDHTHEVKHEINEVGTLPSAVEIRVDGNLVPYSNLQADRLNLIPYLAKDSDGKVSRGRHEVTIRPNDLARIEADVMLRVFIQSHLGGVY